MRSLLFVLLSVSFLQGTSFAQTKLIDSLERVVHFHRHDSVEARALNSLGSEYARKNLGRAKELTHQALILSQNLPYINGMSTALTQLAIFCSKMGDRDSSHYYLGILKDFCDVHATLYNVANFNFTAGLIYRNEGRFNDALPYMQKALEGFVHLHEKTSIAGQLLNIGNTYHDIGDFKNSVDYHLKALKMFEELKNKRGESFCNQSIGNDFVDLGRPQEGLPYLQKALAQKEELKDQRSIASAWAGLGNLFKSSKEYDKALFYHGKALKAAQDLKLTSEEALSQFNIGTIYVQTKDFSNASKYLKASKMLARQMGDSAMCKAVDAELIGIQSRLTTQHDNEQNLLGSLNTSLESGRKQTELSSYERLIEFYTSHKNYERAFFYQSKFQRTRDSLQGSQVQLQIKQLEEQFNSEKKEKEIALLKKDQELKTIELKRQKTIQYAILTVVGLMGLMAFLIINRYLVIQRSKRMVEIERVRNGIARDLHDDIGSTLSSINIISRMALHAKPDENTNGQFSKIEDHSRKMMDNMSDIIWSINPVNDTADKTVIRMKEFAAEILEPKNIAYGFKESGDLSDAQMSVTQRKNLFLIFKESLNNAAKYSQCTSITIDLAVSRNNFTFSVGDNGNGFDQGSIRRGNGLSNMEARAAMMGSTLKIESSPGKGTRIFLSTIIT
jgi:two-component system sensor histidine kinase UhpB